MEELLKLREMFEDAKRELELHEQPQSFNSVEDRVNHDLQKRRAWNNYNARWMAYSHALDSYKDPT